jgi:Ser/Thr protein kinase RdoA (MazF antagonist)
MHLNPAEGQARPVGQAIADHLIPRQETGRIPVIGLMGDGRLTALSSYENRVYQIQLETERAPTQTNGTPVPDSVVAKFYRPGRWTDAQIQEEHDFAAELVAAEVPVVPPLHLQGHTLHHKPFAESLSNTAAPGQAFQGFSYSVSERRGGRPPELDDDEVLEWIGRFLARIHTVGAAKPFHNRPSLSIDTFMQEPKDWLFKNKAIPMEVERAWQDAWHYRLWQYRCAAFGAGGSLWHARAVFRRGRQAAAWQCQPLRDAG